MADKQVPIIKTSQTNVLVRRITLSGLIGSMICTVFADSPALFLSPSLGRPEVVAPGEHLAVLVAGVDGQAVSQARLISPAEPRFAQPLILPSGEQTLIDPLHPMQMVVPRQTPAQVYDLELTIAGNTIRARQAVVIRPPQRQPHRIAHIAEITTDHVGNLSISSEDWRELSRWNVDFVAVSAVRLDERTAGWEQLLNTLSTSPIPVLLAPGVGVDLRSFGTQVASNLTSRLELGSLRAVTAISTPQRPVDSDPEQHAWLVDWLKSAPPQACSVIVMDHGVPTTQISTEIAPLVLAADDDKNNAAYAIMELSPPGVPVSTPTYASYPFGTLVAEVTPADDLAPHAVQLVLRNRSPHTITNATQRVVLADHQQPWCLGGKLSQVVQVGQRTIVDWTGDVPARGVISVIIGTGEQPTLPSITAAFDTPLKLTPQRAASGSWGAISLRNTSTTAARVRPLVMLDECYIPYQIRGLAQQGSGNFRFELEAGEHVELELFPPREPLTTGQHDLQLYLTQLPVWQTLNQPITLAAD